jgi:ATP-dependent Clp protease ATP-binding subunit ClpC
LSKECKNALAHGAKEALTRHHQHIEPQHLLLGLLREDSCEAAKIMRDHGLTLSYLEEVVSTPQRTSPPATDFRDLTAVARNHPLSPLIGRERELDRTIQILSRRTRNNPVLVGNPV